MLGKRAAFVNLEAVFSLGDYASRVIEAQTAESQEPPARTFSHAFTMHSRKALILRY
jgi:hypothetical protein